MDQLKKLVKIADLKGTGCISIMLPPSHNL